RDLALVVAGDGVGDLRDGLVNGGTVDQQVGLLQGLGNGEVGHQTVLPRFSNKRDCVSPWRASASRPSQPSPPRPIRPSTAAVLSGRWATACSDSSTSSGWQTSTTSQPASRCASTRALTPPAVNEAAM